MTLYNPEHFFYPNEQKRYALGTKNKSLKRNDDGSLTIYVGNKSPGSDKESNWLPAPAGKFSIWIRAYWPGQGHAGRHVEAAGGDPRSEARARQGQVTGREASRSPVEEAERLLYAQDAYSSAFTLAVFVIIGSTFSLVVVPVLPMWPFGVLRVAEIALAAVALVFLLVTRGRPTVRGALFYSAAAILPYAAMVLPETAEWVRLGHPLNGFVMPQLLMACVALVVPRYFWLGAAVLALFTVEALGVYAYLVHAGLRELRLSAEPFFSLIFALVGFSLLVMREQRRALAVKHIRAQSEVLALERIGPLFARVRAGLKDCVDALSERATTPACFADRQRSRRREIGRARRGGSARSAAASTSLLPREPQVLSRSRVRPACPRHGRGGAFALRTRRAHRRDGAGHVARRRWRFCSSA